MIKDQKLSFGSFLVGAYLFSVPVFSFSVEFGLNIVPQIIGALLTLYAIYEFLKILVFNKNISIIFYSLFTVWSVISFPFSGYPSLNEELFTLIKVAIITCSSAFLIRNQTDFVFCLSVFFISIFLTFWLNLEIIRNMGSISNLSEDERFAGTLANANVAAIYCLAIIWAGFILLFIGTQNFILKIVILIGLILAGFVVLISGSRKGLLGLGFMILAVAWIPLKKLGSSFLRKIVVGLFLFVLISAIFLVIYTSPFFYRLETMFQGESSADLRIYYFNKAITIWTSSLRNMIMGIGTNNFRFYNPFNDYSHSTISETLVGTGLIGFGLYYTSFFSIFLNYIQAFKLSASEVKIDIILVVIFLISVLFFSSVSVMYADRLFWPLLGIISAYGKTIMQKISLCEKDKNYLRIN